MLSFEEKHKKTLRVLRNTLSNVNKNEWSFIGLNYQSNFLLDSIPVATKVDNLDVDISHNIVEGQIYFRPVGTQIRNLTSFRGEAEKFEALGYFPDPKTEEPAVSTSFEQDVVAGGSLLSNIQEIPFVFYLEDAQVYERDFKIAGSSFKQISVLSYLQVTEVPEEPQQLTFLFKEADYDGESMLGWLNLAKLTKRDYPKVLGLLSDGILTEKIIGSLMTRSDSTVSFVFPVFEDARIVYNSEEKMYIARTDTGLINFKEDHLDKLAIDKVNEERYEIHLTLKNNIEILISIG